MDSKQLKELQDQMAADEQKARKLKAQISARRSEIISISNEIVALEKELSKLPATSGSNDFIQDMNAIREKYGN